MTTHVRARLLQAGCEVRRQSPHGPHRRDPVPLEAKGGADVLVVGPEPPQLGGGEQPVVRGPQPWPISLSHPTACASRSSALDWRRTTGETSPTSGFLAGARAAARSGTVTTQDTKRTRRAACALRQAWRGPGGPQGEPGDVTRAKGHGR